MNRMVSNSLMKAAWKGWHAKSEISFAGMSMRPSCPMSEIESRPRTFNIASETRPRHSPKLYETEAFEFLFEVRRPKNFPRQSKTILVFT